MKKFSFSIKLTVGIILLLTICVLSLSYGDTQIGFFDSFEALFGSGEKTDIIVVQSIRFPRVMAGLIAGATLGLSGLFTRTALKNPLADSSILGIQSGASVMALISLLVFPTLASFLPFFAFIGGMLAYVLVMLFSYRNGFNPLRLVLSGVAINAFFTAITSVITVNHVYELQNSIMWTSGSLVGIGNTDMLSMLVYGVIGLVIACFLIPVLNLLRLDDNMLISLGKNPNFYRFIACVIAVILASISLSFVGLVVFVGIIAPHIAQMVTGGKMTHIFFMTLIIGAILVVGVDLFGRVIFLTEVPVGSIIGVLGAPLFLYLLRRSKNGI
ncbi:MAG: FecCD family ABC transporter permease [Anaerorhabdus sp.]